MSIQMDMPPLCCHRLTSIPESICSLAKLQRLDISYNTISSLPAAIGQLTSLHSLKADHNRLTALPAAVSQCSQLEQLDLCGNQLSELPEELRALGQMSDLLLDDNRCAVQHVPGNMEHMDSLKYRATYLPMLVPHPLLFRQIICTRRAWFLPLSTPIACCIKPPSLIIPAMIVAVS